MKQLLRNLIRAILKPTGFDIASCKLLRYYEHRARLPPPSNFPCVQLALAWFFESEMADNGVLIQIGANDGKSGDPIHSYVKQGKMKSILVEPIPSTFANLKTTYDGVPNVTCCNLAIGMHNGTSTMFIAEDQRNCQIASFSKAHIIKHLNMLQTHPSPSKIKEIPIEIINYAKLLERHNIENVDIVQIDAEGYDNVIVKEILEHSNTLPKFINFEHIHISKKELDDLFNQLENNYIWIHDAINTLAIRFDVAKLWKNAH